MLIKLFWGNILAVFLLTRVVLAEVTVINVVDQPVKTAVVPSCAFNDAEYIDALAFAQALSIKASHSSREHTITLYPQKNQIKLIGDNHFIICNGKALNLLHPVKHVDENIYLPLLEFMEKTGDSFPGRMLFYRQELLYLPRQDNIAKIFSLIQGNQIFIDIPTSGETNYSCAFDKNRVSIQIIQGRINDELFQSSALPPGFSPPETLYSGDTLTINLFAPENIVWESVFDLTDAYGIRLSGMSKNLVDEQLKQDLAQARKQWKFDAIVIDPGHGGKDPGAIGPRGALEKNITLDIALKLEKILKARTDLKVVLTRNKDVFVPLYERGKIANRAGGKLFVSIHCNANKNHRVNGFAVYFLSPARNDQALKVALLENAAIEYEDDPAKYQELTDENYILLSMTQSNNVRLSEDFGAVILESVGQNIDIKNQGLDQAGFYVLYGANMPAVLVETAFISNRAEEEKLRSKKFRQSYAEALAESIIKFCQTKE